MKTIELEELTTVVISEFIKYLSHKVDGNKTMPAYKNYKRNTAIDCFMKKSFASRKKIVTKFMDSFFGE